MVTEQATNEKKSTSSYVRKRSRISIEENKETFGIVHRGWVAWLDYVGLFGGHTRPHHIVPAGFHKMSRCVE